MHRHDRRRVLAGALSVAVLPARGASASTPSPARVRQGLLIGTEAAGVRMFKGVPYARPPLGALRFRSARPPLAWAGGRAATAFGDAPVQDAPDPPLTALQVFGAGSSEDCLYLNVWAPAAPGPHPVMAWIHGGGNEGGAASDPLFDGVSFARAGVVCVTIGYRTGILGFLDLEPTLGPGYRDSCANGLRDIVAALRWIRANIASFGGDPGRVTLAGQSAGAKNAFSVAASPEARGLFGALIAESGGDTVHDPAGARRVAASAVQAVQVRGGEAQDLLTMSPEAILQVQAQVKTAFDRPFPFRAVAATPFLPQRPTAAVRMGALRGVRMLLGANRDESIVFLNGSKVGAPLAQAELSNLDVARAQPVFERYAVAYPGLTPTALRVKFLSAEEYRAPTLAIARAQAAYGGAPVYLYDFARPLVRGPFQGWVPHAAELPYVWNAVGAPAAIAMFGPPAPNDAAMAAQIHARWVAFVHGGAPDAPGAVAWPRFGPADALLRFDADARPAMVDTAEERLWTG